MKLYVEVKNLDYFRAFRAPSKFAQEFLFFSSGLGHLKSADFFLDREYFNDNLVMYVLSGKLHVEQNGHFILSENEGIILRLTERHKYYTDEEDVCEILWMHFNGRQSELYMNYLARNHSMPLVFRDDKIPRLIQQCFTFINEAPIDLEFLVSQAIYSVILTILNSVYKEDVLLNSDVQGEFMNKATKYIEDNLYNKITLDDFANQFNISRFHFCKVFEKYFHITPMKYVLNKRIELSKYILTYTNEPISTIAISLCFTDQSHFSKAFKKVKTSRHWNIVKKGNRTFTMTASNVLCST